MANINEILARAAALRDETALNSISPERAGSIMYDTLIALNELWLQQGAALVINKIYASVAAMEADTNPVSDISGKPLRPGQIVVIASSDSDNGSVYRYNGADSPSWSLVGEIGNLDPVDNLESDSTSLPLAAHQGKVLDGKISQLGQNANYFEVIVSGNPSSYTDKNVCLFAGRRYKVKVENQNGVVEFKDANGNVVEYITSGTYNTTCTFLRDVVSVNGILGENSKITITPLDIIPANIFSIPIPHTDNSAMNVFLEEIVLFDEYDSVRMRLDANNNWIRFFGTKNGVESALTSYLGIGSIESHKIIPVGDSAIGYMIINKDYRPSSSYNTTATVINYTPEYNTRIQQFINKGNAISKKTGVNILSGYEWGKGVTSSGTISENPSWVGKFALTPKLFFGDNQFITCNNCSMEQGFYCATYDAADNPVSIIGPTDNVCTLEKTGNAVYARFTLTNTQGYFFIPQAQYGETRPIITPTEQYSDIGGYLPKHIFYCGPNRPYTTLKSAIEAATSVMDGVLYVDSGVYDLIEEFGSDYFDNITSTSDLAGLSLRNRIHIVFSPNVVVKCHYTGDNEWVMKKFSPFNSGKYGFTLENLKLEASRCRYAIHDEYASDPDVCKSKYINCYIKFDNTNNPYWGNAIIGGGLGCATEIDIQGCTFESVGNGVAIYYHQASGSVTDYASVINIKNNYVISGVIELDFTKENSTNPSIIQISGNSVPEDSRIDENGVYKIGGSFTYNKVYAWNNEIRQLNP